MTRSQASSHDIFQVPSHWQTPEHLAKVSSVGCRASISNAGPDATRKPSDEAAEHRIYAHASGSARPAKGPEHPTSGCACGLQSCSVPICLETCVPAVRCGVHSADPRMRSPKGKGRSCVRRRRLGRATPVACSLLHAGASAALLAGVSPQVSLLAVGWCRVGRVAPA